MSKKKKGGQALLVIAILFISFTLRGPITSVGSLAGLIHDALGVSNGFIGLITTLPLLAFAACSPFLFRISGRIGIGRTLLFGLLLTLVGGLLRSLLGVGGLLIGTLLLGVGICCGNILIPSVIKLKFPHKIGILTSIYITGQVVFAAIGAGISYPLAQNLGLGWNHSLLLWCVLSFVALLIWLPHRTLQDGKRKEEQLDTGGTALKQNEKGKALRPSLTLSVTLFMGAQSLCFYSLAAWLPSIMADLGIRAEICGYLALWFQLAGIPASFLVPILAANAKVNQRLLSGLVGCCYFGGTLGLLFCSSPASLAVSLLVLALGSGGTFAWIIAIIGLKSRNSMEAARLTGVSQSVGYLLAAAGPTLCGFFFDVSGAWVLSIGMLLGVLLIMFLAGIAISREEK